jgi:hypothetical protein
MRVVELEAMMRFLFLFSTALHLPRPLLYCTVATTTATNTRCTDNY